MSRLSRLDSQTQASESQRIFPYGKARAKSVSQARRIDDGCTIGGISPTLSPSEWSKLDGSKESLLKRATINANTCFSVSPSWKQQKSA